MAKLLCPGNLLSFSSCVKYAISRVCRHVDKECAVGSVVEHRLHTAGVTGSNPVPRTKIAF